MWFRFISSSSWNEEDFEICENWNGVEFWDRMVAALHAVGPKSST